MDPGGLYYYITYEKNHCNNIPLVEVAYDIVINSRACKV